MPYPDPRFQQQYPTDPFMASRMTQQPPMSFAPPRPMGPGVPPQPGMPAAAAAGPAATGAVAPAAAAATQPTYDQAAVGAILGQNADASTQANITRARKLADAMRSDAASQLEGRSVSGGRIYVAPGLANLAANMFGNYTAGQMSREADTNQAGLGKAQAKAAKEYWDMLRGVKKEDQGKNNLPGMVGGGSSYGTEGGG